MRPMERTLLQKTRELLDNCDLSLPEIANMSGLGYEWLKWFKRESTKDPGIKRVETLHNFLAQRQIAKKKPAKPETMTGTASA